MKFDELDARTRVYETVHDFVVLPHSYMVARLDGSYELPARDACVAFVESLMG